MEQKRQQPVTARRGLDAQFAALFPKEVKAEAVALQRLGRAGNAGLQPWHSACLDRASLRRGRRSRSTPLCLPRPYRKQLPAGLP